MNDSIGLVAGLIALVASVLLYVWFALALSALFRKAGEDGWQGWVPLLNTAVVLRLGGFSPWMLLIALVPVFGVIAFFVIFVIACHRINRAFGLGAGMTVVAALFTVVWASILGFGSSRWIGAEHASPVRTRGGFDAEDAAAPPLLGPFFGFDSIDTGPAEAPPVRPAPPAPPAPAAAAPAAAGFWAPPPSSAPSLPPRQPLVSVPASTVRDAGVDDSAVDPEDRIAPPAPSSGSLPPPPPPREAEAPRAAETFAPIESVPVLASPLVPEAAPPTPVVEVPPPPTAAAQPEPESWAPAPLRTPAPEPGDPERFPELSEAISAVAGAPDAGSPRSARSSVSALYAQPELGEEEGEDDVDAMDQTIVARRRRVPWALIPPGGTPVDISSEVVILGRRPSPDPAYPGAQLISISDETRTVSKTHARLELRGETWFVTDLGSTNGVLFATLMGTEIEVQPGQELEAGERFFLGDAEVRLRRSDA